MLFSPLADGLHARHAQRAGRAGHACPDRATRVWMLPLDVELRTRHDASARKAESRACACAGKWRAWGPSLWRPNALFTLKSAARDLIFRRKARKCDARARRARRAPTGIAPRRSAIGERKRSRTARDFFCNYIGRRRGGARRRNRSKSHRARRHFPPRADGFSAAPSRSAPEREARSRARRVQLRFIGTRFANEIARASEARPESPSDAHRTRARTSFERAWHRRAALYRHTLDVFRRNALVPIVGAPASLATRALARRVARKLANFANRCDAALAWAARRRGRTLAGEWRRLRAHGVEAR